MEEKMDEKVDFDLILSKLGGFGKFQSFALFLASFSSFVSGALVILPIFSSKLENYRCYVPNCDRNVSKYEESFLNFSTPWDKEKDAWSGCTQYVQDVSSNYDGSCSKDTFSTSMVTNCSKWVYDTELFHSTTVSEFDLTCDRVVFVPFEGSAYMLGMMVGTAVIGWISDQYGRKMGVLLSACFILFPSLLGSVMPNYWSFLIMKFLTGPGGIGAYQVVFIAAMELVETKRKALNAMVVTCVYAFGELYTVAMAYFIRDWRYLHVSVGLLALPMFSYYWIMPESIRWLACKGKQEKIKDEIDKAAKMNNVPSPVHHLNLNKIKLNERDGKEKKTTIFDILKKPNMRKRFLILSYCWIVCAMVYFGLSANANNLYGDIFTNLAITIAVEIPACITSLFILDRYGRKVTNFIFFLLIGITCVASSFLASEMRELSVLLTFVGKFASTSAFLGIALYTGELFPTEYRAVGTGACCLMSRFGGIMAQVISGLGIIYKPLPTLIFGIMGLIAGATVIFLPETAGMALPQTVEESENFGCDHKIWHFGVQQKEKKIQNRSA